MTDKTQVLDDLTRASEMEEAMNMTLSGICSETLAEAALPEKTQEKIMQVLDTIHKDTLRHISIVGNIIEEIRKGAIDE